MPDAAVDAAVTAFGDFVLQTWFLCLASASAGLAAGLWFDVLLERRETPRREEAPVSEYVPIARRPVRQLSDGELVQRVTLFRLRLSTFETEQGNRRDEATKKIDRLLLRRRVNNCFDKEKRAALQGELDDMEAFAREWEAADPQRVASEFKVRFSREAAELRGELSRRTGVPVGGADDPTREALDRDRLDGAALKALERRLGDMAGRLPGANPD